jgi:hypothetical protein
MWIKKYVVKSSRNGIVSRFNCSDCNIEQDFLDHVLIKKKCNCKPNTIDSVWREIQRSATGKKSKRTAIEINITKNYIVRLFKKQEGRCALSNEDIILGVNASLDRIDSNKGYIKGNVQWVHKDVNLMKGMFSLSRFLEVCKLCTAKCLDQ